MSLCTNCVWKTDTGCFKAVDNFPDVHVCMEFIITNNSNNASVVRQVEWESYSTQEPSKCIYYALLP